MKGKVAMKFIALMFIASMLGCGVYHYPFKPEPYTITITETCSDHKCKPITKVVVERE